MDTVELYSPEQQCIHSRLGKGKKSSGSVFVRGEESDHQHLKHERSVAHTLYLFTIKC